MRAMRTGKWLVVVGGSVCLVGCITTGQPLERVRRGSDIPLVPVPPPPLGRPDASPAVVRASSRSPASAPSRAESRPDTPPAPSAVPTARQLINNAQVRYARIDSYIVRLTRREVVNGEQKPEEVLLFKFRKKPWSLYLKWLASKDGKGREVVYVKGQHENKIHTLLAAGDIPFVPAGRRMALAPDNVLVRSSTRHSIHEAGFGTLLDRLASLQAAVERGDRTRGRLELLGPLRRPEFEQPVQALEHTLPPRLDPSLPKGGKRTFFFDPETQLPMLIRCVDERGQEVEYYRHAYLQPSVNLDDADFDPDQLWGKPQRARR
jgi:hypothetical protein